MSSYVPARIAVALLFCAVVVVVILAVIGIAVIVVVVVAIVVVVRQSVRQSLWDLQAHDDGRDASLGRSKRNQIREIDELRIVKSLSAHERDENEKRFRPSPSIEGL